MLFLSKIYRQFEDYSPKATLKPVKSPYKIVSPKTAANKASNPDDASAACRRQRFVTLHPIVDAVASIMRPTSNRFQHSLDTL
jgi:hypothetical protein